MYAIKPKKPYTGPPRPNLMSHDKTIREITGVASQHQNHLQQQQNEIDSLKRKLNQALYRIDLLTNHLRKNR